MTKFVYMESRGKQLIILALLVPITLVFHFYSELLATTSGQSTLLRHVLADLCYIPIVLSAIWFGLRGAIIATTFIAGFSLIFLLVNQPANPHEIIGDYAEIVFFYLVGAISGIVLDRDRRLRAILEKTQRNLNQAERLSIIGQMVASIVHEIKNPLVSISGAVRIMREKSITEEQKEEYLTVIDNEARHLDEAVHQLLSYPRPDPTVLSDIDIREPLAAIQKQLSLQSNSQGVRISLKSTDLPPVKGDRDKLYHAFSNIIINAMQAMPQGGRIDLICSRSSNPDGKVIVEIADNGPGINKDILPKLFQPFFSTKSGGTGLGLVIAKSIIKEHGGNIEIDSAEGKGTKFTITLPTKRRTRGTA
jgi:two-component system sensor histidine kinase HydH